MKDIAYIYKKDTTTKVLNHNDAEINHKKLIKKGYSHIATINTIQWIENSLNLKK